MFRITLNGKPYLRPMPQLECETLANRLTRCLNGVGMMKVQP